MSLNNKWAKLLALALSLPSSIFVSSYILMKIVEKEYLSKKVAILIFLAIIGNTLLSMVIYAIKNNKKN